MALSEIRKLGDPILLEIAAPVSRDELEGLIPSINKMWSLILEFRSFYGRGRAMAAPQAGLSKRIICLNIEHPEVLINPFIEYRSKEMIDVWDDCMSFPNLLVKLKRHRRITISYFDLSWKKQIRELADDMSELLQHEYDHLDGILALSRCSDPNNLKWTER
jgi:peptide deformylase